AGSIDITSSKWPCLAQSLTMRTFPSRSMIRALICPGVSFSVSVESGLTPSRISVRISGTHFGQRESVSRGQPSGGLTFSQDFNIGLSDQLGVDDRFGLIRFTCSKTHHEPCAA